MQDACLHAYTYKPLPEKNSTLQVLILSVHLDQNRLISKCNNWKVTSKQHSSRIKKHHKQNPFSISSTWIISFFHSQVENTKHAVSNTNTVNSTRSSNPSLIFIKILVAVSKPNTKSFEDCIYTHSYSFLGSQGFFVVFEDWKLINADFFFKAWYSSQVASVGRRKFCS